ncbi:UNVERIFIED_CONTAM: nickel-type superoxide dismutase maturation protease [Euhalothece sp. KZN 001]
MELPDISVREFLLWILGKRKRFRVKGNSMLPLLKPEEEVLIDRGCYQDSLPKVGEIVVAKHPIKSDLQLIKRVTLVSENGSCFLMGDNPEESTDSRQFGKVNREQIIGRVTCRFG